MTKISKYITYQEATFSATAVRRGIANVPDDQQLRNMRTVATEVFDKVRAAFGSPIRVTSFFRSAAVNRAIGGSRNSQHTLGEAIDMQGVKVKNSQIFWYIRKNLEFDQLIWEFGNDQEPDWVHVSFRKGKNRRQVLQAVLENGKQKFVHLAV
jgi:zinc D-Ala-D-Ala carboxypeptidase